jgi:hypothetical protein
MELHMQSLTLSRRSGAIDHNPSKFGRAMTIAVPLAVAALAASAAYAGADTTFTPALTKFTYIRCSIYVLSRFDHQRIWE